MCGGDSKTERQNLENKKQMITAFVGFDALIFPRALRDLENC